MMSLLWYYRPEHLQGGRSPSMHEVGCLASVSRREKWWPHEHGLEKQPCMGSQVIVISDATDQPGS